MKSPRKLLVATRNAGKLRELQQILSRLPFTLVTLNFFPEINEVPETGRTFEENAQLKAEGYASQTKSLTLADDSGLEIDALGGVPGLFSARYLGETTSFEVRIRSLLNSLSKVPRERRTARFICAVAIADAEGQILYTARGVCEGHIALNASGSGGFGYDPIFVPNGYDLTFGELDPDIKNEISHRARALSEAAAYLLSLTSTLSAY